MNSDSENSMLHSDWFRYSLVYWLQLSYTSKSKHKTTVIKTPQMQTLIYQLQKFVFRMVLEWLHSCDNGQLGLPNEVNAIKFVCDKSLNLKFTCEIKSEKFKQKVSTGSCMTIVVVFFMLLQKRACFAIIFFKLNFKKFLVDLILVHNCFCFNFKITLCLERDVLRKEGKKGELIKSFKSYNRKLSRFLVCRFSGSDTGLIASGSVQ